MKTKKILLIVCMLCVIFSVPAFAASDKALRCYLDFNGRSMPEENCTDEQWGACSYNIGVYSPGVSKIPEKVEISGDVIIPVSMMKNKKSWIDIQPDLNVNENASKDYEYIGCYPAPYTYGFHDTKSKAIWNELAQKHEKVGKNFTLKKKGKYYVVHFVETVNTKKVGFEPAEGKKLNLKKKNNLTAAIVFTGNYLKSGYIYLDNIKIKASTKTYQATFTEKGKANDYRGYGYMWCGNGKFEYESKKCKVVNRPA